MMTRHSTMVVGPTGGGKSVIIETLCKAQTYLDKPTKLTILNPKVIYYLLFLFTVACNLFKFY